MAKRKYKKRPVPVVRIGEVATPERRLQLGGVMTEVIDRDVTGKATILRDRAQTECMLDRYYDRFVISKPQFMAGLKFREIYLRVNCGYNVKVLSQPFLMDGSHADPEWKMLAHIDCARKLQEVYGILSQAQQKILRNVCGHDEFAQTKDNKATLVRALAVLAGHWGYAAKPSQKRGRKPMSVGGALCGDRQRLG